MEEQTLNTLMSSLREAQRGFLVAEQKRDDVVADIMAHGFSREAVRFALATVEADPRAEYATMVQAKELIEASEGDTAIEFVSYVETPYRKDQELSVKAYQAGRAAREAGERCVSPYSPGILHRKWLAGWKDAKPSRAA